MDLAETPAAGTGSARGAARRAGGLSVVLLLLGLPGLLAGCATVEERWASARAADTVAAYEEFLRQHPGGDLAEQARSRLRDLREEEAWQVALGQDTRAAYEEFLRRHGEGRHAAGARERLIAVLVAELLRADAEPRQRAQAAGGLVQFGGAAVPALFEAVEQGGPMGRREVISTLVRIGRVTLEPVLAGLDHPSPAVRSAAAEALGLVGDRRGLSPLTARLRDEHPDVRQEAAAALTRLEGAAQALLSALRDREPRARQSAAISLARMREERAVRPLLGLLADPDAEVRRSAGAALAMLGPAAGPSLVGALGDADPRLRRAAAEVLGVMAHAPAIEPLARLLDDAQPEVRAAAQSALHQMSLRFLGDLRLPGEGRRRAAVEALARIGPPIVPVLLDSLREADPALRAGAAEALGRARVARAAPRLVALLGDADPGVRAAAAGALEALGPRAAEHLLPLLRGGAAEARTQAAGILARLPDPETVEALVRLLGDADESVRGQAQAILTAMGGPALAFVAPYLQDREYAVRRAVAGVLGRIGDARAVRPLLAAHADPTLRSWALQALVELGAVGAVADALHDPEAAVRLAAAETLGEMRSPAALTPLLLALQDTDAEVRAAAARALGWLQEPAAVPHLLRALREAHEGMRRAAADGLAALGAPAVPALIPLLEDRDPAMRRAIAAVLARLRDVRAVPALVAALQDRDEGVRAAAAAALAAVGPPAVEALLAQAQAGDALQRRLAAEILGEVDDGQGRRWLEAALADRDAGVREQAAAALGKQREVAAIPALLQALKDPEERVRARATGALAGIGLPAVGPLIGALRDPAARRPAIQGLVEVGEEAVDSLVAALADPSPEVRGGVADALGEIGAEAAIPALVAALQAPEASVQWRAAWALEMFGEDVPAARAAVDAFLAARGVDLRALASDHRAALKRGQDRPLVLALERHGTPEMAADLLRAGDVQLRLAAERWARLRGYAIAPPARPAPRGGAGAGRPALRPGR